LAPEGLQSSETLSGHFFFGKNSPNTLLLGPRFVVFFCLATILMLWALPCRLTVSREVPVDEKLQTYNAYKHTLSSFDMTGFV